MKKNTVKKPNELHTPESYSPKKPKILSLLGDTNSMTFFEKIGKLPRSSGEPPKSSKIPGIHRLYYADKGENFMFDGCVRGVLEALGEPKEYDYNLVMALCGDMFTQMYKKDSEADCLTDNCFIPEIAAHAFKVCGYESVFITKDEIDRYPHEVMTAIKQSVLRDIPVISMGIANIPVTVEDGTKIWNGTYPVTGGSVKNVPFASMIGGYDEDKILVNVWIEEADTDENGYATTQNALDSSQGLIFIGEKANRKSLSDVYQDIIYSIPAYLTLRPMNGYTFAKDAFYEWANNIKSGDILKAPDKWNMHFAPAVILYTNTGRARSFINRIITACPDFELAKKLQPLYEKAGKYNNELDRIQGGFEFNVERFAENEFNKKVTDVLYRLGDLQEEILKVFSEE